MLAEIMQAVDRAFDRQVDFLKDLVAFPSTRGNEAGIQLFIGAALAERGLAVDTWALDDASLSLLPGYSPNPGGYGEDALNVVGTHQSRSKTGRSLILNAHVDVVPTGPTTMWTNPPFQPICRDAWMYGRGAGDMKAGLSANIFALDALRDLGFVPAADCFVQSVIEEECTGNGALACLQRGYHADAVLIPEPFAETLVSAQIGVIWMQVQVEGVPAHVASAQSGVNAIEAMFPLIAALKQLELRWNDLALRPASFAAIDHPLNLNIGMIRGGDWPSSVPAHAGFDVRMAIYPGQDIEAAKSELEACIQTAAASLPRNMPTPRVLYHGFLAAGYELDVSGPGADAVDVLEAAHRSVHGAPLPRSPITATTDARFFGLHGHMPTLVYGPVAKRIHGYDECVDLESVRRVTQATALFIAYWCGLEHK